MRKRFSLCKKVGVFLLTVVMCTSQLNVQAEKKYDFETEYQVVAGANGYFIAKNQKGEYGLLDSEGEKAVGFDYSEMEFPEDTIQYQYIKVKQNDTGRFLPLPWELRFPCWTARLLTWRYRLSRRICRQRLLCLFGL